MQGSRIMSEPPPATVLAAPPSSPPAHRAGSDVPFFLIMGGLGGSYVLLILGLLVADIAFTSPRHFADALAKPEIQYAIRLTLITCSISALLSIWVATPLGYLRGSIFAAVAVVTAIDIPVVLPPLVGLSC
jgi:molybdate transport system permease protein